MIRLLLSPDAYAGTKRLYDEIKKDYQKGKSGYLFVPEQYTLQSESQLMNHLNADCLLEIQVGSFAALTREVLENQGGLTRIALDEKGRLMLLQKVCREHKEEFRIFKGSLEKEGFLKNALKIITELQQRQIHPSLLMKTAEELESESLLAWKIKETVLLLELYQKALGDRYTDDSQRLFQLAQKLRDAGYLKGTHFYFNAFYGFTQLEYHVIRQLMKQGLEVTFALTFEEQRNPGSSGLDVFASSRETIGMLKAMAEEEGQEMEALFQKEEVQSPQICHLSRELFAFRPVCWHAPVTDIHLRVSNTLEQEVEETALQLQALVRKQNLRYGDICVAVADGEAYFPVIRRIFEIYAIPCFMDEKREVIANPITAALEAIVAILCKNFQYEDVFSLIKTGLTPLTQSPWEELENWVLRKNIRGSMYDKDHYFKPSFQRKEGEDAWASGIHENHGAGTFDDSMERGGAAQGDLQQGFRNAANQQWGADLFTAKELEEIRWAEKSKEARDVLQSLFQGSRFLAKGRRRVKDLAGDFCALLQNLRLPEGIQTMQQAMEEENLLEEVSALRQVWKAAMDTLDQLVEILGDQEMKLEEWGTLFLQGLKSCKLGLVPPKQDQVMVSTIGRSRQRGVEAEFLLGWCDDWIPSIPSEEGLWTNEEKEELERSGIRLPSLRWKMEEENHLEAYEVLRRARSQIFVSYPLKDASGNTLRPSGWVGKIKEIFPLLVAQSQEASLMSFGYTQTTRWTKAMQTFWKEETPSKEVRQVLQYMASKSSLGKELFEKQQRFSRRRDRAPLGRQKAKELYGKLPPVSASRLESYYACPFRHFVRYGLRPQERKIYQLENRDTGSLLHRCAEKFGSYLGNFSLEELLDQHLLERTMNRIFEEEAAGFFEKEILESSRHQALLKKIRRSAGIIGYHSARHMALGKFELWKEEVDFGPHGSLPPFLLETSEGPLSLEGRIDRVDLYRQGTVIFVKIIDYKSGNKTFSIGDVYFGIDMQLLVYLLASMGLSQKERALVLPGGAFYFPMVNPMVEAFEEEAEQIQKKQEAEFVMEGIALKEESVVLALNKDIESGACVFQLKGRSSSWKEKENLLTREEMAALMERTAVLALQGAEEILKGELAIQPFRRKDKSSACDFCRYGSVCGFDRRFEDYEYRELPGMSFDSAKKIMGKAEK